MRKKSHILLGWYLAERIDSKDLRLHKKAFCYGNVLPDLRPSFVTVRHEFNVNFHVICKKIRRLSEQFNFLEPYTSTYWTRMGEIVHYVADYFTFPHNEHFEGTIVEHTLYERELKIRLNEYILSGQAMQFTRNKKEFETAEDVIFFIKQTHDLYMRKRRSVEEDIRFIVEVCYQVVWGIIQVMETVRAKKCVPEMLPEFV